MIPHPDSIIILTIFAVIPNCKRDERIWEKRGPSPVEYQEQSVRNVIHILLVVPIHQELRAVE